MPVYEFTCNACGERFEELFRSRSERRRMACPTCHSRQVRKLFSTFALSGGDRAKGGGGSGGGCATCRRTSCASCRD
jgi:putative FmdB family regulatory protein